MNLESFAIGILTIVIFILVIIAVIGMLKAVKFTKRLLGLEQRMDQDQRELYANFERVEQHLFRGIDDMEKAANSYTDRRIDKLIDSMDISVFASKKEKTKKQILKD
jgi:hypothetical protein